MIRLALLAALLFSVPAGAQHSHGAHSHETAFGRPAGSAKPTRTVRVDMTDNMRFTPAEIRVKRGEIVSFVATNKGKVAHEIVLGTMEQLEKHAEKMRSQPQTEHDEEDHGAEVAPGKSGSFAWQFRNPGEFYYGCLIPGHFEAGMVGKVIVSP